MNKTITQMEELRDIGKPAGSELTTGKAALRKAAEQGLIVVVPKSNQLQLDIDSQEAFDFFNSMQGVLSQKYGILGISWNVSKSGGENKHVTITLNKDVTPTERILLQATLGSDRKRELLSYFRILNGDQPPTIFFEKTI